MKNARLSAAQNSLLARGICQSKAAPARLLGRCTNDRDGLCHHDLITDMRVQVTGRHEAGLSWVSVNPTDDKEFFFVTVVEQLFLVERLTRVACTRLLWYDQTGDEQSVVF